MSRPFGYSGKILWVDLTNRGSHLEERGEVFWRTYLGGGLAATKLLLEETPPGIDPLDEKNGLIFASSVVAGHYGAGLSRFTTVAKSPLTGGIGETRTEGPWGYALKGCGADILVFTGKLDRPSTVVIEEGAVEFLDSDDIWGKTVGDTVDALEEQLGAGIHVAAIGPAGENLVRFASVVTERTHLVSRMGMGAVMGSKRLKAIVLKEGKRPAPFDHRAIERLTEEFAKGIMGNDLSRWQCKPPGFSCWVYLHGLDAALCVNNYRESTFDNTEAFSEDHFLKRSIRDLDCPGCPNNCIKAIHPIDGDDLDPRASGTHQEITGTMGPNIGVGDLDVVLRANNLCNQYGMDPTSLGFTISFAMELFERGILTSADNDGRKLLFGDGEGALEMMEKIARRKGLGDILAEGTRLAAGSVGQGSERYAMHVKGLEMVCFEPRSQTNLAMGYAVAPIGPRYDTCEHDWDFDTRVGWSHSLDLSRTLGILDRIPMEYIGPDKVRNFKVLFNLWSGADALDFCIFAIAPTRLLSLPKMSEMLRASTGWETSSYEIIRAGERRVHLMRWYNAREGLTADDDRLPDRFYDERIESGPRRGDVINRKEFHEAIRTFYRMMGWDEQGRPLKETLYDHGLEWVLS
jgi:aldehyde:ferredoxin oxidoreductase